MEKLSFELGVSSIVISTNAFGDFSKCTVISKLVGNDDMEGIVQSARQLWQKFIHQPQTARCLVFFLVLGKICEHITQNYKDAVEKLTSILELNVSKHLTDFEIADCLLRNFTRNRTVSISREKTGLRTRIHLSSLN